MIAPLPIRRMLRWLVAAITRLVYRVDHLGPALPSAGPALICPNHTAYVDPFVLVACGTASGPFPPVDAFQLLMQGSVYVTRPGFADYYADPAERAELSALWFGHLAAGRVKVEIGQRYALDDCIEAHRELEAGQTIGSSIFVL